MSCTFPRLQSETLTDPAQKDPPGPVSSVLSGSWKAPVAAAYVSIVRNVFSCSRGRIFSPSLVIFSLTVLGSRRIVLLSTFFRDRSAFAAVVIDVSHQSASVSHATAL